MPTSLALGLGLTARRRGGAATLPGDDVWLIIGQSNATGTNGEYDADLDGVADPRAWNWPFGGPDEGERVPAVDELYHQDSASKPWDGTHVGFGPKFARLYAATIPASREVLLVPAGWGGTTVENWLPDTGQPDPAGGLLLPPALEKLDEALALQPGNRFKGVLWHQGEGDQASDPDDYATKLDEIIAFFADTYPGGVFLIGQQVPEWLEFIRNEKSGAVASRSSNSVCDVTGLPTNHSITTANTLTVYWDGGIRTGCSVTADATNQVTIGSGSGTNLPANGVAVTLRKELAVIANRIHDRHVAAPGLSGNYGTAFWYGPGWDTALPINAIHYSAAQQRLNGQAILDALPLALANVAGVAPVQVSTPTALTIGAKSCRIRWTHPACRVTKFQVDYRVQGAGSWTTVDTGSRELAYYFHELLPNTTYEFRVFASNETGDGTPSAVLTVILDVPGQPTGLTTGTPTTTAMPLTWTAPVGGAVLTDYVVQHSPAGAGTWTTFSDGTSTATSTTVTGLTPGTSYDFRVSASNASGSGTPSATATASTALNPVHKWDTATANANLTFDESGRRCVGAGSGSSNFRSFKADRSYSSGKKYCEIVPSLSPGGHNQFQVGLCKTASWSVPADGAYLGNIADAVGYYDGIGTFADGFTLVNEASGLFSTTPSTDVYHIAFDVDAGKAWLGKNGTWYGSGDPAAGTNPWVTWTPGPAISFAGMDFYTAASGHSPGLRITDAQVYASPSGFTGVNG